MKIQLYIQRLCVITVLIFGMMFLSSGCNPETMISGGEMKIKSTWFKKHLLNRNPRLPFSFIYDDKISDELLGTWPKKTQVKILDGNRTQYTLIWTDIKTGLEVRCVSIEYFNYPVVEWTVYFRNTGTNNTPILKDIWGLNTRFVKKGDGEFFLHCNKGDWQVPEGYEPYHEILKPNTVKRLVPNGGRPTSGPGGWPYYNMQMPEGGLIVVVGWPGQFATSFARDDKNGINIEAGQELTNLYLKPGEEIRSPLIVLQFWQGINTIRAQNIWRRWYMAHTIPKIDGRPPEPMTRMQLAPDLRGSEKEQFIEVKAFEDAGIEIDLYWHDAGWYQALGTWEVDTSRFPNGFKPIADWVHARGKKLIVWFEPENVGNKKSWLALNRPEWLLGGRIMNMGNPIVQQWVLERIDSLIKENNIDYYRQDFNVDPLNYWRANDSVDRQGITENFYIQGHLAFWDELKRRHPEMLIDACASGGRRNDLETMRRAVPLLRTDYVPFSRWEVTQGMTYGISHWLPYHGLRVGFPDSTITQYVYRSFMMPFIGIVRNLRANGFRGKAEYADMRYAKIAVDEFRKVAPMMLGDYYPLTPYNLDQKQWMAWQFNRPEQGDGMVQAFRRENCDDSIKIYKLSGLNPKAEYEVTNFDVEGTTRISGSELMNTGLRVEINKKPGSYLITYKIIPK